MKTKTPPAPVTPELTRIAVEMVISLRSPLHIACTRQCAANKNYLRVENRAHDGGDLFPATGTQHYPIASAMRPTSETSEEGARRTAPVTQLPIIPPTLLRGRLRRLASELVFAELTSRKQTLSLGAYHGLRCGAVTGQPASERLTLDEAEKAATHPFIGLLGGGPRMVRSTLVTETGWPINETTLTEGIVPDAFADHATDARSHTRAMFFRRVDDLLEFNTPIAPEVIAEYPVAVREWMDAIGENASKRKADRTKTKAEKKAEPETKKSALQSFSAIEAVMPGVRYYLRQSADCSRTGYAGFGLFLLTLQSFVNTQALGGWVRHGFGDFDVASATLRVSPSETVPLFAPRTQGAPVELDMSNPLVEKALDAWANYAANTLTSEEIEYLMRVGTEPVEEAAT